MTLLRHLSGYAPVKLASALASFGGVYAFTRLLGPESYGRYALMLSLLALIHTFALTWVEAANYRFAGAARENKTLQDHYAAALVLMRRSILVGFVIMAVIWWFLRDEPGYARLLPWVGLLMPISTIIQMALEAHRVEQRVGRYVTSQCMRLMGGFGVGVAIALIWDFGAAAPLIGMAVAGGFIAIREAHFLRDAARGGQFNPNVAPEWLSYGAPIAAALILDILLSAADRFIIAIYLGEAAVGAYAAGYGVADKTVLLLCAWAALAASPLIMAAYERAGPEAARTEARGLARTLLLIGLPAAFGIAFVAQPLGEVMVGEALRADATMIMPWIAFAGLLNGFMVHYAGEPYQLTRRTGLSAIVMLLPAGLNIVLNIVLLPPFGLMGAVYATLISYGVGLIALAGIAQRLVPLPWPIGDGVKCLIAALAMGLPIAVIPDIGGLPQLMIESAAGAFTYAITLLLLDAVGVRRFLVEKLTSTSVQQA